MDLGSWNLVELPLYIIFTDYSCGLIFWHRNQEVSCMIPINIFHLIGMAIKRRPKNILLCLGTIVPDQNRSDIVYSH